MSVVEIGIGHEAKEALAALTPEAYEAFRGEFPDFNPPEDQTGLEKWWPYHTMHGTEQDFWALVKLGVKPSAKRIRGTFVEQLPHEFSPVPVPPATTSIVNVSVPNAALFAVQSITWVEDACTDAIQHMMDEGWRIVAVCPPNDTRRPTYIMGHFEKGRRA